MAAKKKNFEESITELEAVIGQLEDGDLPLEEAMKAFEKGVSLSNDCQKMLDDAQQKVSVLLKGENGQTQEEPMEAMAGEASSEA